LVSGFIQDVFATGSLANDLAVRGEHTLGIRVLMTGRVDRAVELHLTTKTAVADDAAEHVVLAAKGDNVAGTAVDSPTAATAMRAAKSAKHMMFAKHWLLWKLWEMLAFRLCTIWLDWLKFQFIHNQSWHAAIGAIADNRAFMPSAER
jgi:hypothetical protein